MYRILIGENDPSLPLFKVAWERELNTFITEEWEKSFILAHKSFTASSIQETNYKIITRWYRCPYILHAMDPALSSQCWCCETEVGSMHHIWWSCPHIQQLWEKELSLYDQLCTTQTLRQPKIALLSILPGSIAKGKKGLLHHFLSANCTVIPRHWQSWSPPTIA